MLLTQVARDSGQNPAIIGRGVMERLGVTNDRWTLPIRDHQAGGAHSSVTIVNEVFTIGTAMAGGIAACVVLP